MFKQTMRYGLSYAQAAANSNIVARKAYDAALFRGLALVDAQEAARVAYNNEMEFYES